MFIYGVDKLLINRTRRYRSRKHFYRKAAIKYNVAKDQFQIQIAAALKARKGHGYYLVPTALVRLFPAKVHPKDVEVPVLRLVVLRHYSYSPIRYGCCLSP